MCTSLFSLLNWSHLRETFGLICILIRWDQSLSRILIRPILITSQKKRLFNWAPPGFFSKHVLIYPAGNTYKHLQILFMTPYLSNLLHNETSGKLPTHTLSLPWPHLFFSPLQSDFHFQLSTQTAKSFLQSVGALPSSSNFLSHGNI